MALNQNQMRLVGQALWAYIQENGTGDQLYDIAAFIVNNTRAQQSALLKAQIVIMKNNNAAAIANLDNVKQQSNATLTSQNTDLDNITNSLP